MTLFLFNMNSIWTLLVFLVDTDITLTLQAARHFETPQKNDFVKQGMTRLLSLPGYEMSDATQQRDSLQSYEEELQTLKYVPKSPFLKRRKRSATKRHNRIQETNHECRKKHFRECRCAKKYRLCKQKNNGTDLTPIYESKWTEDLNLYNDINCKLLCEQCICTKILVKSPKSFQHAMTKVTARKITTTTMALNTSERTKINDEGLTLYQIIVITAFGALTVPLVSMVTYLGVLCKRRYTMHRQKKYRNDMLREADQNWFQYLSNKTTNRLERYPIEDVGCNIEVETFSHHSHLDSLLSNLTDQEDNVSMRCESTKVLEHMDEDVDEDTCNASHHDLLVSDSVSEDRTRSFCVSGAVEKYSSLSIRRFTAGTLQAALEGNSSSPKITQCKNEVHESNDQQTIPSDKQLVKECPVNVENVEKRKISIVQPLTGPVQEQNKEYLSSSRYNWDEIFRYLAKNLTTSDYKLFFNILYGSCHHLQLGGDRDTGSFIEKVETRVRRDGGDSETLMFELFNQWKQIMGSNVTTQYIEEALRERSNNLALEKFKEFMRTPPLLPRIPERRQLKPPFPMITLPNCGDKTLQYFQNNEGRNTNHKWSNFPQYTVLPLTYAEGRNTVESATREINNTAFSTTGEMNDTTNGPVIEEIEERDMDVSSLTSSSSSSGLLSDRCSVMSSGEIFVKQKRSQVKRGIMNYGNEEIPSKVRKMDAPVVPFEKTRRKRKQHKSTAILELHEMTQNLISLVKQFLPLSPMPLQAKQYSVFLKHTIGSVTKQTGESRNTVLSLSFSAYCETETFKTKRNDKFYFMYVKDRCLMLGHEEFENLRLYAEFARRNLVREITKQNGGKYKEPEALFLSYDGKPFLKKKKVVRVLEKSSQEASPLLDATPDEFPTSSSTLIPEKYDSTVREKDKDHVTSLNSKMDPVTSLEDTGGLPNTKMDCSSFEVVSKGSEKAAPGQHLNDVKDIMGKGSIDMNNEHKIPYLGDDSEKETSKAFPLKENDEAGEIEDLKVPAADYTLAPVVSGATNVTLQDQIVSDTNICDMVRENAQCKRDSEIMFACLSCLIQNEIHNDPKSPGTFLPIELD